MTDQRSEAITAGEHAPRASDEIEAFAEDQDEDENRERIQQDANWKPARDIVGAIQLPATDPRQDEGVHRERDAGEERGLRPRQESQQQREGARPDVDPLPRVLGVTHRGIESIVARTPSASGDIVYPRSRTATPLSSDQSWRKISTAPRVINGSPPNSLTRSSSATPSASATGNGMRSGGRRPVSVRTISNTRDCGAFSPPSM